MTDKTNLSGGKSKSLVDTLNEKPLVRRCLSCKTIIFEDEFLPFGTYDPEVFNYTDEFLSKDCISKTNLYPQRIIDKISYPLEKCPHQN